jgi:beta-glucosidase
MKEKNADIVSEEWLKDYHNRYEQARTEWKEQILEAAKHVDNPFDAYAANPFAMPDGRAVTNEDIKAAEAAIYVISRISGEGKDRRKRKGDYYLSDQEEKDLYFLNEQKIPTVLIINAGGPVELTDLLAGTENICAILNISQLGQEGGNAVADILFGEFTPSGKLTTTWTKRYDDCPAAEEFSYLNGNLETEEYAEGIYVGYRYFDSFGIEPLFSFGYGLSYTEFDIRLCGINTASKGVTVTVEVENTGTTYSGKEVVQIYASLPQDGSRKEFRRLVGYEKTEELKPGEKEILNIVLPAKAFASFLEEQQEWRIQAGAYGIWIGNSLSEAKLSAGVKVSADVMMEKTKKLEDHSEVVEIKDCAEELCRRAEEWTALLEELPNVSFEPEAEEKKVCRFPEETEIPVEDLISLLYGNMSEIRSTLGASGIKVPGTAGETSEALFDQYGIPSLIMADGPAGIRLQQTYEVDREKDTVYGTGVLGSLENGYLVGRKDHEGAERYYQYCTAFPVGTALAQSWNKKLMEQFGRKVAAEMEEFHINLWLAPGLNIHRNPLCGRNFEYYSEDPFLAGTLAAAVTRGVQSRPGCGVTIKHFACNNQEDNRMGVDAHISERTLREIYLRGFEIAVKEGAPTAIMSSYNLINGVHAANSKDLCTRIAREEWGFDGVIMSDWNTTVPEDGSIPWVCVAAGNDIIMPGNPDDDKNIREAYKEGKLTEKEIRLCANRILKLIRRLS